MTVIGLKADSGKVIPTTQAVADLINNDGCEYIDDAGDTLYEDNPDPNSTAGVLHPTQVAAGKYSVAISQNDLENISGGVSPAQARADWETWLGSPVEHSELTGDIRRIRLDATVLKDVDINDIHTHPSVLWMVAELQASVAAGEPWRKVMIHNQSGPCDAVDAGTGLPEYPNLDAVADIAATYGCNVWHCGGAHGFNGKERADGMLVIVTGNGGYNLSGNFNTPALPDVVDVSSDGYVRLDVTATTLTATYRPVVPNVSWQATLTKETCPETAPTITRSPTGNPILAPGAQVTIDIEAADGNNVNVKTLDSVTVSASACPETAPTITRSPTGNPILAPGDQVTIDIEAADGDNSNVKTLDSVIVQASGCQQLSHEHVNVMLGLAKPSGGYSENFRGQGEKYMTGTAGTMYYPPSQAYWYYLLPDGSLHEFTGDLGGGPLVGVDMLWKDPAAYVDPAILHEAGPKIIDNGDTGYTTFGNWGLTNNPSKPAYSADIEWSAAGSGTDRAQWTFTNLVDGDYEVAVTWSGNSNRATNTPYEVFDGAISRGTITVDQQVEPIADYTLGGRPFQVLFAIVQVTSGSLVVELNDNANGYVMADAVQVKKI